MTALHDRLRDKSPLLCDGATGTNYFALGLETGHPPEFWCVEHPERVEGLHQQFLAAGSDIILTNSFGGNEYRLKLHDAQGRVAELNAAAARLGRKAADAHSDKTGKAAFVAGSMGPTGELFAPLGALEHEAALAAFAKQADALANGEGGGGVDLLWIETMSSMEEVTAAMEAAASTGLPYVVTMTFDTAGKSMMGIEPQDFARKVSAEGALALGANCGIGPAELLHSVLLMRETATLPVVAKGNCGIPQYLDGAIHYHGSPALMAHYAHLARDMGAAIIGGCCGTTPEHIAAMRKAIDTEEPLQAVGLEQVTEMLGQPWKDVGGAGDAGGESASPRRARRRRKPQA